MAWTSEPAPIDQIGRSRASTKALPMMPGTTTTTSWTTD
jgi:hypothetical protein